ncbi:hypothetical protein [Brevibacillus panacihumi]|uniref:Uncharacterized protein n=1 Tax=Brevibacillus panacihumi TaxID=497735 RepID=A0A3M8C916_9BACL|nr:hypothetical protein [Brevibacillus panacihumi]RNB72158.1 hypothetical protein EDM58_21885 [Brevibacillus panacihumi]
MSIRVTVFHGENKAFLEIAKPNNKQVLQIIRGVFGVFGFGFPQDEQAKPISLPEAKENFVPKILSTELTNDSANTSEDSKSDNEIVTKMHSKQLPYVNSARTLSTPLGEKLGPLLGIVADKEVETNHPESAPPVDDQITKNESTNNDIKVINGLEHYRTRVYCKNAACGKRSNRWIPVKQKSIQCPHCKTIHVRRDATVQGFPNQDQFGNFFKADNLWIGNHKSHAERIKSPIR